MSNLPERLPGHELSPRQFSQAVRAQQQTELAIYKHGLLARHEAECDRQDTQALADVLRYALDEEVGLLDYGQELAAGSAAKTELVIRKVDLLSSTNNQRIARRFGA